MYDSVRDTFLEFNEPFEGLVPWMYLDIRGLVTIGVGNLIDPVDQATRLHFVHADNVSIATREEIEAEWNLLKSQPSLAKKGHRACKEITRLRLTRPSIQELVAQRLQTNETKLATLFSDWHSWPADAQLGVLSMAWALGAGFPPKWPNFTAAAKRRDWTNAKEECCISTIGNPGIKPRNAANQVLFANAQQVESRGLDPSKLYYPAALD